MKRKLWRLAVLVLVAALAAGITLAVIYIRKLPPRLETPETLGDLAFDANRHFGFSIYIEEGDVYTPYYVLTKNYNEKQGAVLLLRKYLLDELREYHPYTQEGSYSAYYENSSIDRFLNTDFFDTLSPQVWQSVLKSTITIAARSSLATTEKFTLDINRKVFLLSLTELDFFDGYLAQEEGTPLLCFDEHPEALLIARHENGKSESWWIRTAETWGTTSAWIIGYDGWRFPDAQTGTLLGVRPAFCLPGDLSVELRAETNNGAQGYVIAWE